jgi:transcription elongation factor Elf1
VHVLEHHYSCPYCGETISSVLDPSESMQRYIEDCEVCCQPIELECHFDDGLLGAFDARRTD